MKSGQIFVRRKWSGHEVPIAASSSARAASTNSITSGASVKCITLWTPCESFPRSPGTSSSRKAAFAASSSGFATGFPKGSAFPFDARWSAAFWMTRSVCW